MRGRYSRFESRFFVCERDKCSHARVAFEFRILRGELWRSIAADRWPAGGRLLPRQPTEPLPPRLVTTLNRHPDELGPMVGIWNYTVVGQPQLDGISNDLGRKSVAFVHVRHRSSIRHPISLTCQYLAPGCVHKRFAITVNAVPGSVSIKTDSELLIIVAAK